jgi:hypothetical protein
MIDLSRRLFVGGGLAFAAACSAPLRALASEQRAVRAGRFYDSVGICTHPNWRSGPWGRTNWENALLETRVMHTRGKIGSGRMGGAALVHLEKLFARGVKICATVADQDEGLDREATKANLDFLADAVGPQNISGIESANEYNNPHKKPADWASELRDFQKWLHDTVRADPRLAPIPLVAPSIWGRVTNDYLAVGNLEPNVDKGCLHYYTGGRRPTIAGKPRSDDEGGGSGYYSLADAIKDAKTLAPTKPLWITEYGYPVTGPGLSLTGNFITEAAASKYLIRGLLDAFGEGVERTYIYSLIDDVQRSPPRYHGLLDGDLRARPSFQAIENLIALFADNGGAFAPAVLKYNLANVPQSLKSQLFQKSDGTFLLTMYQDVDSYDRLSKQDIAVAPTDIHLSFDRSAAKAEVFTPTFQPAPTQVANAIKTLTIPVGDHVTVVRMTF